MSLVSSNKEFSVRFYSAFKDAVVVIIGGDNLNSLFRLHKLSDAFDGIDPFLSFPFG